MKTLKLILLISIITILTPSCRKGGPWGVKGKGNTVTETKNLSGFDKIHLSIDGDVYFTQDSVYKVEISAQQNILAILKAEVIGSELKFDFRRNVWDHKKVKIVVHAPNINRLSISSSGDINVAGEITTTNMELSISGSGNIYIPTLIATNLKATISGNGDVKISGGSLKKETFNVSGSGDIDAEHIVTETSVSKISGIGDITVNVTESLDATISGSGDIRYRGNPSVKVNVSGIGKVERIK